MKDYCGSIKHLCKILNALLIAILLGFAYLIATNCNFEMGIGNLDCSVCKLVLPTAVIVIFNIAHQHKRFMKLSAI